MFYLYSQFCVRLSHQRAVARRRTSHTNLHSGRRIGTQRGVVLLLVVALLTILALMGTVFILSASADKQATYAANSSTGLNLAQAGVISGLCGTMLNETLDQSSRTLTIGTYAASSGKFTPDSQIARYWDCPHAGNLATCTPSAPQAFFQTMTATPQVVETQPWLTNIQPWQPFTAYLPGATVLQVGTSTAPPTEQVYMCILAHTSGGAFSGSGADWLAVATTPAGKPLISELAPYLFDPSDGLNDISYQSSVVSPAPGGVATVNVPNASVTIPAVNSSVPGLGYPFGTRDAMWNLLPISAPDGARYRYAIRVTDLSALLNLNTGWIPAADANGTADPAAIYGQELTSCPILGISGVNIAVGDTPAAVQNGNSTTVGRGGTLITGSSYTPFAWQASGVYDYEQQGAGIGGNGTSALALFGTNSAIELLTQGGGIFGTPVYTRPMLLAGSTFGFTTSASYPYYIAQPWRNMYTSYSFSRDIAPLNLSGTSGGAPPARLDLNMPISSSNLASFSQQLYSTLLACGFNPQHACSFLVNYLTYRFDSLGFSGSPAYLSASGTLTAPTPGGTLTASLNVYTGGSGYMGTTAQPFLNEVDVKLQRGKSGAPTVGDWAVEILNAFPGSANLPLSDYSIEIIPSSGSAVTVSLSGESLSGYSSTSNGSFGVVCLSGGGFYSKASSSGDGFVATTSATFAPGPMTVELLRSNVGGSSGPIVVDSISVTLPTTLASSVTTEYADVSRNNTGSAGVWGCDSNVTTTLPSTLPTSDPGTIGSANAVTVVGNPGVPLYDRFYSGSVAAGGTRAVDSNDDLFNLDDLNCCAREACTTAATLPQQLAANTLVAGSGYDSGMYYAQQAAALSYPMLPDVAGTTASYELFQAAIYFDFAYDPRAAVTLADQNFPDLEVTSGGGTVGEIPPSFLAMTTLTDRSWNTTDAVSLPGGAPDLVRLPGKININTASQDVLYSAFSADGAAGQINAPTGFSGSAFNPVWQMVADTVSFRDRMTAGATIQTGGMATLVPTPWYGASSGNYSSTLGFHGMGDLLLAFLPSEPLTALTTLQQRDATWADVAGFLTVRSDTFAVYGYIQALRLNPQWTGIANYQPVDWYNANQGIPIGMTGSISPDATANAEFVLNGTRRFIAIVDRSLCNNGAAIEPQVVEVKSLP